MRKHREDKLFDKYPTLYQRSKMPSGFECGNGWYEIIYIFSRNVTTLTDKCKVLSIKEKDGKIDINLEIAGPYNEEVVDKVLEYVNKTRHRSLRTCEYCGRTSGIFQTTGKIVTICKRCFKRL